MKHNNTVFAWLLSTSAPLLVVAVLLLHGLEQGAAQSSVPPTPVQPALPGASGQAAVPANGAPSDAAPSAASPDKAKGAGSDKKSTTSGMTPIQASPIVLPAKITLPITFSYRTWNGMPIVDLSVNERRQMPCTFDTGMNANAINPAIAALLKLEISATRARIDVLDREAVCELVNIKSMSIGNLPLTNVPAVSLDVASLISAHAHPDAPQVWLGTPFLSAFQFTFDFPASSLTLSSVRTRMPSAESVVSLPLVLKDGRPYVTASILNGKPFLARIDTGSVITLIPGVLADKLQLRPLQSMAVKTPEGLPVHVILARLQEIAIGRAARKNILVAYFDKDAPASVDRTVAVLGADFFSRFKVTFSYKNKKIAIELPNARPAGPAGPVSPSTGQAPSAGGQSPSTGFTRPGQPGHL